jgi:general secretion pathway protein H
VRCPGSVRPATGFTLLEVLVVLVVLAVAAALTLPAIRRGTEGVRLRTEAGRVAAVLREARQRAVRERQPTRVALEEDRQAVVLSSDAGERLRRVELSPSVRVEPLTGGPAVTFTTRGVTRDARWAVQGPGGRRLVIDLHGLTGRVTVAPGES